MQVSQLVNEMDMMVSKGQILEAVDKFFADNATSQDHDGTETHSKAETHGKLSGFLGAIKNVNGISFHRALIGDAFTMSEYTFDFDMKDGSRILWHEIIHREWKNGKVVKEMYFKK